MVREGVRGVPATVTSVTMPAAEVTPAEPPPLFTLPTFPVPAVSRADILGAVCIAAGVLLLVLIAHAVIRALVRLDQLTDTQYRMLQTQTTVLDSLGALLSGSPVGDSASGTHAQSPHGLATGVCHELVKIDRRVKQLPENLTQARPLARAVERLARALESFGYTARDLTGEPYTEGMRVSVAEFATTGAPGSSDRIERTLKPEIRFKGTIIQQATVVVSTAPSRPPLRPGPGGARSGGRATREAVGRTTQAVRRARLASRRTTSRGMCSAPSTPVPLYPSTQRSTQ